MRPTERVRELPALEAVEQPAQSLKQVGHLTKQQFGEKKQGIEILRLVAIILITFIHTKHNFESGISYYITEVLPKFGTLTLSIVSGYLYWTITKNNKSVFSKKVKSLVIPYFIANSIVIGLAFLAHYIFSISFSERVIFDYTMITEGLLSLNSPPINPPTYFVRDIFIIFTIIELIRRKNLYMLLIIVPYLVFGKLLIRLDIMALFLCGAFIAHARDVIENHYRLIIMGGLAICLTLIYFTKMDIYKYAVAILIFMVFINIKVKPKFLNTGGFSYLLFLYHSPIIVGAFPALSLFVVNPYLNVACQIIIAITACFAMHLLIEKYAKLRILTGGR
jgi:peptidoglycan/LPS O-acetylase OafA/YrhL